MGLLPEWNWKLLGHVRLFAVHGILQARILEWVAFPFSRGSSQPRDWNQVSHIAGGFFISWATREAQEYWNGYPIPSPVDLPDPGIEPGSPALQVDFLPTELWGKPILLEKRRKWRTWRFKWSLRKDSNSFPLSNRWEVKRWVSEDKTGITELPCWSSG